jgi:dolichol-phosphate mannosyltransferase
MSNARMLFMNIDPTWEYPTFTTQEFAKKRHTYCVCVFVINEGAKFQAQLKELAEYTDQVDVIIGDLGSTDGSMEENFLRSCKVRTLLTKTGPGRQSAQMRMAFAYALSEGYEGIIVVDGNHKDGMEAIPNFVKHLKAGYDHIQGSRFIPGGIHKNTPLSRLFAVKIIHAPLISLSSGFHYTDTTNGFRGYSRRLLLDPRVAPFRDIFQKYEMHFYLAIRSANLKFKVIEIPVRREYPGHGPVPTKISPIKGNLLVLQTLFNAITHRYDPK